MTFVPYRRLPGKRRTAFEVVSLYLGPDHLLQVRSTRINEEYQRFYFQDVQSVVLCKTAPFHYVWAAVVVLVASLTALISKDVRWPLGLVAAGGLFLWLRGPSCAVQLETAGATRRLRSLHRLKTARRAIPLLCEQIEAVQGVVESVPEEYGAPARSLEPPPLPFGSSGQALRERRHDHAFLFGFLSIEALLLAAWLARPSPGLEQTIGVVALIEFLALVLVLVRQSQQRVRKALRNVTFLATGRWFVVQTVGVILVYKAFFVDHIKTTMDPVSFVRGTLTPFTLVSLLGTAAAGLWLSFRRDDD